MTLLIVFQHLFNFLNFYFTFFTLGPWPIYKLRRHLFDFSVYGTAENGLTDPKRLWPDGIIYYIIDPPLEDARKGIEAAMKEYERVTKNCIRFVNSKGNGHYLKITSMEGCYSTIGMAKGMQILSLRARGCWDSGVYLHELGHTIGLYHEQSRSDRDKYIRIFWDNIAPSEKSQFFKLKRWENFLITPYDPTSIMEYGPQVFSKNGKPTMEARDPNVKLVAPYGKTTITNNDLKLIMSMYNCPGYPRPAEPKVPEIKCTFSEDTCIFEDESGMSKFHRTTESGNGIMVAEGRGKEFRFITKNDIVVLGDGNRCISFRYRILLYQLEVASMSIYNDDIGSFDKTFQLNNTPSDDWKQFRQTLKPTDSSRVYFDVRIGTPAGKFNLDDFDFKTGKC
ncbi:Astacin-like metalloendopeptidase [Nymphon striatum]|nr:Astacin-like metalloendopeptidase [Nymphon striatum]